MGWLETKALLRKTTVSPSSPSSNPGLFSAWFCFRWFSPCEMSFHCTTRLSRVHGQRDQDSGGAWLCSWHPLSWSTRASTVTQSFSLTTAPARQRNAPARRTAAAKRSTRSPILRDSREIARSIGGV
jgi:hypothetical protein